MSGEHRRKGGIELGRRQLFGASLLIPFVMSFGLSGCSRPVVAYPGAEWRAFLSDVAALLIPRTDTAAADDLYVWAEDIALNGIYVGMDDATFAMVGLVQDALNEACGGAYLSATDGKRYAALEALDAASFGPIVHDQPAPRKSSPPPLPQQSKVEGASTVPGTPPQTPLAVAWRKIKGLLLLGYYTSEAGASKELRYELVPGRYDPDVSVTPDTRAISSDWFAVSFR